MKNNEIIDITMSFAKFACMVTSLDGRMRYSIPKLRRSGYDRRISDKLRKALGLVGSECVTFGELSLGQITSPEVTPDVLSKEGIRKTSLDKLVELFKRFGIAWKVSS